MKYYFKWQDKHKQILKVIYNFSGAKKIKLYIVGGALRDIFLKREKENPDIDFCLKKGAINFARQLAKELKCGFVVLDPAHGCARLVHKAKDKIYTLDFSDFRGKDLREDLYLRDFTVNSLSLGLESVFKKNDFRRVLIDPYGGVKDLEKKVIRLVNPKAFDQDPVRILRAFSLASKFNFKIHPNTFQLARLKKKSITQVSWERIRDELFKILATGNAGEFIEKLDKEGMLKLILPEIKLMHKLNQGPYHHLDVWGHTLETLRQLELIIKSGFKNIKIRDCLSQEISSGRQRLELLKLAALLHDVGKPSTLRKEKGKFTFYGHEAVGSRMIKDIAVRLKLSNEETRRLRLITFCHLRPGYLANNNLVTPRAKFRFFRDTADEALSVLLLSLSDQRATKGVFATEDSRLRHEKMIRKLIREYFKVLETKETPRLVNGDDLVNNFKLKPSPLIGKILAELDELQGIGRIKTKKQGLKRALGIINNFS
ncbi:MAG: HD domain-containing protein [Candidatus Omnitrophota bacterium]